MDEKLKKQDFVEMIAKEDPDAISGVISNMRGRYLLDGFINSYYLEKLQKQIIENPSLKGVEDYILNTEKNLADIKESINLVNDLEKELKKLRDKDKK